MAKAHENGADAKLAEELCRVIDFIGDRGWAPGTGGNFSVVTSQKPLRLLITSSGIDKTAVQPDQLLTVNRDGQPVSGKGKPSAETLLHTAIARQTDATCILHTHSIWNTVLSRAEGSRQLRLSGYEMLKGLAGVQTHEHEEVVPIFENAQDMVPLAKKVNKLLKDSPKTHGFLLRGHGLYTWGTSLAEAKRHVEIFEFLFECEARSRQGLPAQA